MAESNRWRKELEIGYRRGVAEPIRRQRHIRLIFDAFLIASVIFGFGPFWLRLVLCVVARLVYVAFASSDRFAGRL